MKVKYTLFFLFACLLLHGSWLFAEGSDMAHVDLRAKNSLEQLKGELIKLQKKFPSFSGIPFEKIEIENNTSQNSIWRRLSLKYNVEEKQNEPDEDGNIPASDVTTIVKPGGVLAYVIITNRPFKLEVDNSGVFDAANGVSISYLVKFNDSDSLNPAFVALKSLIAQFFQENSKQN